MTTTHLQTITTSERLNNLVAEVFQVATIAPGRRCRHSDRRRQHLMATHYRTGPVAKGHLLCRRSSAFIK